MKLRWDRISLLVGTLVVLILATVWTANAQSGLSSKSSAAARSTAQESARPAPSRTASPAAAGGAAVGTPAQAVAVQQPSKAGPSGCPATSGDPVRSAPLPVAGHATTGRTVALTFDDGPSRYTAAVLQVLAAQHVPATFFEIGKQAAADPSDVKAVAAGGNQIGNHTWSHEPPAASVGWSAPYLSGELSKTTAAIKKVTHQDTCWFRPPDGITRGATAVAAHYGIRLALWSVDTEDWKVQDGARSDPTGKLARTIAVRAIEGAEQEHPVVLMHDGGGYRGATVAALTSIIQFYRSSGYTFVRLDGR
jgi:peptidoglycan/xylan/chitin deacetylase (PgdA/CDA1 family)